MARKRYTPEQIIWILPEAEVRLSQGDKIGTIVRSLGVSKQSYYRWRREYGGLNASLARNFMEMIKPSASSQREGAQTEAPAATLFC